ncbi:MAG: DNA polymerase I [Phycisphaerae bacterium]|nr:DNA polymerase I [Phycisphaerae bacterium]
MPKSFYIIDGHAQIYRAYFAPFRDLNSASGEPTKATYVFTQMLLNLIQQRKPDYLAMVIDQAGDEGVFRREIFPEYKANRKERPDDFGPQETRILQIVKDAGVPIFAAPGFEADDIIATMANQLCSTGEWETFLVSKDKDLRQLLTPCTHMYDVQADEVIDTAKLEAKVGYGPAEAVEVQTLMGDAIDNIPGIPGIGEKTACKLIKKYGTADAILDHLDELTPKMRENFQQFGSNLAQARKLVTLRKDVPMQFDPEECRFNGLNVEGMRPHLVTLGFKALLDRIGAPAQIAPVKYQPFSEGLFGDVSGGDGAKPQAEDGEHRFEQSSAKDYETIDTQDKFDRFLAAISKVKRFAFDTETDALGAMNSNLVGMSFSWEAGKGFYLPVKGPKGCVHLEHAHVIERIKPILENPAIEKVGHNIKYDLLVMRQAGIALRGIVMDSMVAAFLIDASRMNYGIDPLALSLLNFKKIPTDDLIGKGRAQITMDCVALERIAHYASEDADICWRLAERFDKQLSTIGQLRKLHDEVEVPLIDVLVEMEANGIAVDPSVLKAQSAVLGVRIEELKKKILDTACCGDFNPDSPKQLADVLFNKLGLKSVKKTKTGHSTDTEVLEKLANDHAVPNLVLEYRGLVKLKNTYLDNLTDYVNPRTGRIHANFNQAGASSGRLSCKDPNLQNIPIRTDEGNRIRSAFIPGDRENNVLLTADYSQVELRIFAHLTQEQAMMKAFENDEDIHQAVAADVFGVPLDQVTREQRTQAKTINFGIIYGVTAHGLARRIEGLNFTSAAELIALYHKRFPSIKQFFNQCVMQAQSRGFVETILGRRRPIPEITSNTVTMRNYAERLAINAVVQGSAADLIKVAMVNVHRRLKRENRPSKMLLQVHDELVFETPEAAVESEAEMVREEMTGAMTLSVPLKVEVGWAKNWQEVK